MTAVAFCGLGQMGMPMARRLVDAGYEVRAWNRTRTKAEELEGATVADTPAEAARGSEAIVTMLATPDAVREVVAGSGGIAAAMGPGATLIEMSTVGPDVVKEIARQLRSEASMLDAPVLGSVPQATSGALNVLTGGSDDVVARWRELLECFGTVWRFGGLGAGAAAKLVVNSTLGALMTALGEALALADGLGLEREQVLNLLMESPLGVTAKRKRDNILADVYEPNFKLALAAKDMRLVADAAGRQGIELKVAEAARAWFEAADKDGLGDLDYSAVIKEIVGP